MNDFFGIRVSPTYRNKESSNSNDLDIHDYDQVHYPDRNKESRSSKQRNSSPNGQLHCLIGQLHSPRPTDIDRTLNEDDADKIRDCRGTYKNRHSNTISFMSSVTTTSGSPSTHHSVLTLT